VWIECWPHPHGILILGPLTKIEKDIHTLLSLLTCGIMTIVLSEFSKRINDHFVHLQSDALSRVHRLGLLLLGLSMYIYMDGVLSVEDERSYWLFGFADLPVVCYGSAWFYVVLIVRVVDGSLVVDLHLLS
jgi:hypothetical protein